MPVVLLSTSLGGGIIRAQTGTKVIYELFGDIEQYFANMVNCYRRAVDKGDIH